MKETVSESVKMPISGTYCVALYHSPTPDEAHLLSYSTNPEIVEVTRNLMVERYKAQRLYAAEMRECAVEMREQAVRVRERCESRRS